MIKIIHFFLLCHLTIHCSGVVGWSSFHAMYRQYGLETGLYRHGNCGRGSSGGMRWGQRSSVAIDDPSPRVGVSQTPTSGGQNLSQSELVNFFMEIRTKTTNKFFCSHLPVPLPPLQSARGVANLLEVMAGGQKMKLFQKHSKLL